jgi:predicted acetyltransferase
MLHIKRLNREDIEKEYKFLTELESQDGFENHLNGISFESFKNDIYEKLENYSKGIDLKEGYVPETYFFLWNYKTIVGIFKIRHYLNDALREGNGHIGYAIHAKHRRQGYATKGLSLVLKEAKHIIKEDEIYFCCYKYNKASIKAQIKNGAVIHHMDDVDVFLRLKKENIK